ncbi:MAG: hypothetical protein V4537_15865 [Pseudomonadota bacterium]
MTALARPVAASSLSRIEGQVLRTVRWSAREERWNHPTLSQLRAFGFVTSEPVLVRGKAGQNNRWSITDAGIAAYTQWR